MPSRIATANNKIEVNGESATEFVAQQLRESISYGRHAPGQRLVETDIARDLKVSRNTVRAALAKLESEGLVELTPNRGCAVRKLTRRAIADVMDIRATLDAFAASLAASRIDEQGWRHRLKEELKIWKQPLMLNDPIAHLQQNARFHHLIFEIAGNQKLVDLLPHLQVPSYRMCFRMLLDAPRLAHSASDHLAIGDAILAGDRRKAAQFARTHIQWSSSLMQSLPDSDFEMVAKTE